MSMTNETITLDEYEKLTEDDWKDLSHEKVESILHLLGAKEIETEKDLKSMINAKKTPFKALKENILIDFYGTWCRPCRVQDKMFARFGIEILKKCFPDLQIYRCNVDKTKEIDKFTRKLAINSIPILAFLNSKVHFMYPGTKSIDKIVDYINERIDDEHKNKEEIAKILKN